MDLMQFLAGIPGIGPVLPWVAMVVTIASGLATVWRPEWPGYGALNMLATNIGQARNATDPKVKP